MKGNHPHFNALHWRSDCQKGRRQWAQVKAAKHFSKETTLGIGFYKEKLILTIAVQCAVENEQGDFLN